MEIVINEQLQLVFLGKMIIYLMFRVPFHRQEKYVLSMMLKTVI